ncbi:tRNA (adenosine(37)-N6)-threonylcarbamoyltransferase complex transferase subunit TsaD [Tichowtungia aerotolerans]|uniref:tRNA N6-adenosine threonylcarbamoyltransferase n=1 Tax=Tichowtungia aerotolerans TaxID=2697043 RepID=A0A6P1MEI2_9BACT|nr:tRNA (adenosine(37)-N6)-threonylcarbamoyltransferase complex transferase subunit TsaD [Tichowtungia aerotolerans]QHI69495.1 tRNA (adenosine(37)-N6)-threonylcarbamoyltransferase complex transferase subunit TsaD [Tichowtungia aerotolerans]
MIILGIESSCDETAAAVVIDGAVKANAIYSQIAKHAPYGGVVPEIASRDHVKKMPGIIEQALTEAGCTFDDLDGIAVTYGPGLASSLLIGYSAARALSQSLDLPLMGMNHHEGHIYSVFLGDEPPVLDGCFPMLTLMVSGGDTRLVYIKEPGHYEVIGQTIDDAAGEALDKGSTLLGLGYPGGPAVQKFAEGGNPNAVRFPRGLDNAGGDWPFSFDRKLCFSFSGLKTALLYHLQKHPSALEDEDEKRDVTASYQEAVADALTKRMERALKKYNCASFACAGGVSLNRPLREKLAALSEKTGIPLKLSSPRLCTDNAAMIAGAAAIKLQAGLPFNSPDDVNPNLSLTNWSIA